MFERLCARYGKRRVISVVVVAFVLLVVGALFLRGDRETASTAVTKLPLVTVATPSTLASSGSVELIGTVDAVTQAKLIAESAGRVVSVNASLGATVAAGTIIAQIENASERAAVLQAQGVYEGALALAEQGTVGIAEAENALTATQNSAVATHGTAYTTVSGIVRTTLDQFFSQPEGTIVGLRINGRGYTSILNAGRVSLQSTLITWQQVAASLSPKDDIEAALASAQIHTTEVLAMIDIFLAIMADPSNDLTETEVRTYTSELNAARSTLVATESALRGATTQLVAAKDTVAKAKLGGGTNTGTASAAEAQVKQALGALRSAEANLAKTIIRTPITGTVNLLTVRAGDYVGQTAVVAEIANTAGLEVTTYISETEAANLTVGTVVTLGETATGTITSISPAISSETGKVEVRIGSDSKTLKTGSTVKIRIATDTIIDDSRVMVPLTAVKLTTDAAVVFTVSETNTLTAVPVTLGAVSGERLEIVSGLTNDTAIVLDVRGRKAGEAVEVAK
jgi:RND family efflux transporter MFP subunit